MNIIKPKHILNTVAGRTLAPRRQLAVFTRLMAEGDTGATRAGGQAHADSWTRREKAAEDMYIKQRERMILEMLREKIAAEEAVLAKDRAALNAMADQYGKQNEEKGKRVEN